jgi:hypothetical protein
MKRMFFSTNAEATVQCDVPDYITDPYDIEEYFHQYAEFPVLSAQGSGWGQTWSLDLGEEWNVFSERVDQTPFVEDI